MKNKFQYPDLETKRTWLRILAMSDAEAIFHHFSDDEVTEMMDIDSLKSIDSACEIIKFHTEGTGCRWGIFGKDDNQLYGTCGFHRWLDDKAEIGYDLSKKYWGKGLMQEVLEIVIPFGFEKMKLKTIKAECTADNIKSIKLLEKYKFQFDRSLENNQKRFKLCYKDWLD